MSTLTHPEKIRILKNVILGGGQHRPSQESPDQAAWRQKCEADVEACYQRGEMPVIPWDSHDPDDNADGGGGEDGGGGGSDASVGMSQDAAGHEHKGDGAGGGQFASTGGGGGTSSGTSTTSSTPHAKAAHVPAEQHVAAFHSRLSRLKNTRAAKVIGAGLKYLKDKTVQVHGALSRRYGPKTAMAIMLSGEAVGWGATGVGALMGVPVYIPGSAIIGALPGVAIAETVLQLRRATGLSEGIELSSDGHPDTLTPKDMTRIFQEEVVGPIRRETEKWAKENEGELQGLDADEASVGGGNPAIEAALSQAEAAGLELSDSVREQVRRVVGERYKP